MAIFRGTGGQGDSTTDTTVTTVTQKAAEAASSATSAANSATSAANSASAADASATIATNAKNATTTLTDQVIGYRDQAESYASDASAARGAALTAQAAAETAEANAVTAKNQAESARDNAQTAQTAAETAETNAETAYANTLAIFGDAQDVQDAVDSATTSATTATTKAIEAATSATNAATSAGQAAIAAQSALLNAGNASSSATDAETAQTAAETAQTAAETAKTAAETAQAAAETAETNASASATSASGSATSASTSAGTATTKASEASTSATNAATSESNASTSATNAANSATAAQTAQTAAETAQAAAEAAQEAIDGLYLGTATSNPTVDLNGDPVTAGDWYFNTTDNTTRIYDGSAWNTVNPDLVGDSSPQLGGELDTNGNDISFGDNVKAKFGASDDLEIYHDGSHSYVRDQGVGNLILQGSGSIKLQSTAGEDMLIAYANDATELYYDNSKKFETTSSGVDITGTVVADKFEATSTSFLESTNLQLSAGFPRLILLETDTTNLNSRISHQNGALRIETLNDAGTTATKRLDIDHSTGDISFYDDAGTSQDFYWDASTSRLGLGITTPSGIIHATSSGVSTFVFEGADVGEGTLFQIRNATNNSATGNGHRLEFVHGNNNSRNVFFRTSSTGTFGRSPDLYIGSQNDSGGAELDHVRIHAGGDVSFYNDDSTSQDFYWDASTSRLGIGTTSPSQALDVNGSITMSGDFVNSGNSAELHSRVAYKNGISTTSGAGVANGFTLSHINNTSTHYIIRLTTVATSTDSGACWLVWYDESNLQWLGHLVSKSGTGSNHPELDVQTNGTITVYTASASTYYVFWQTEAYNMYETDSMPHALGPYYMWSRNANDLYYTSGNVGIGTTSPEHNLHISSPTGNATIQLEADRTGLSTINFADVDNNDVGQIEYEHSNNAMSFSVANTQEAMRIDSSGNLLVGKTAVAQNNTGVELRSSGLSIFTQADANAIKVNRTGSDGDIAVFSKGGTNVGSIGVASGNLNLDSTGSNIIFKIAGTNYYAGNTSMLYPSTSSARDLGGSSYKWKDLYLSGGVYLGGTGADNLLDDYETGTFTPEIGGTSSTGTYTYGIQSGVYTKVGDLVTVTINLVDITESVAGSGTMEISGLPFTADGTHVGSVWARSINFNNTAAYLVPHSSVSKVYIYEVNDAASGGALNIADIISGSSRLYITLTYKV